MKNIILLVVIVFFTSHLMAQNCGYIQNHNFENDNSCSSFYSFDNTHASNSWQIGKPQKPVFNSALSGINAIITDTLSSYATNDTSVFTMYHTAGAGFEYNHTVDVTGYYMVNTDSLNDFGKFEISPDNGVTWIDALNPGIYGSYLHWGGPEPVFTGNTNGWQEFRLDYLNLSQVFTINTGDTIKFKFTFISDGISESKDGLMFDSFTFNDLVEGIKENYSNFSSVVFPNPTKNAVQFSFNNENSSEFDLTIKNTLGQVIIVKKNFKENDNIDVSLLSGGVYLYTLSNRDERKSSNGKFIVN